MLTYLRANWKQLAGVAVAAAVAGYFAHRCPQPAVHLQEEEHKAKDVAVAAQQHQAVAPIQDGSGVAERVVVKRYAVPGPGCIGPGPLLEESTTERGPVASDSSTNRQEHQVADRRLELTVTPAPRPGWQLQVGLEDVLGPRSLRVAARRRLFGPFWGEISAVPATRSVGAGLAVEW